MNRGMIPDRPIPSYFLDIRRRERAAAWQTKKPPL